MEQLIDELLVLARAGAAVTGTEPTSLAAVAERAADTVRLDAARLEVPDGIVECDSERLRTLLETLFRNALEHGTGTGSPRPDAPADGPRPKSDPRTRRRTPRAGRPIRTANRRLPRSTSGSVRSSRAGSAWETTGSASPREP